MLEVFVDFVKLKEGSRECKAHLCLSTERGERALVKFSEKNDGQDGFMTRCLSKYSSGMYSKERNEFVPECDITEDMQGYEPYHLNYCPEYVERECEDFDDMVSGYKFGSLNPIYGGKVKAYVVDVMHYIDDEGLFRADIALYDDNNTCVDIYSAGCNRDDNRNAFVLENMKKIAANYYYSVEGGFWDMYRDGETPEGTFYGVDFDIDEDEVMDYDLTLGGKK